MEIYTIIFLFKKKVLILNITRKRKISSFKIKSILWIHYFLRSDPLKTFIRFQRESNFPFHIYKMSECFNRLN